MTKSTKDLGLVISSTFDYYRDIANRPIMYDGPMKCGVCNASVKDAGRIFFDVQMECDNTLQDDSHFIDYYSHKPYLICDKCFSKHKKEYRFELPGCAECGKFDEHVDKVLHAPKVMEEFFAQHLLCKKCAAKHLTGKKTWKTVLMEQLIEMGFAPSGTNVNLLKLMLVQDEEG